MGLLLRARKKIRRPKQAIIHLGKVLLSNSVLTPDEAYFKEKLLMLEL